MINKIIFLFFLIAFFSTTGETLEIVLWEFPRWKKEATSLDRFYWMRGKIAQFETENPGIHIQLVELSWKGGREKIKIAAMAGAPPDIAVGAPPLDFIQQGWVQPLDELLSPELLAEIHPELVRNCRVGKSLYLLPWYFQGQVMYCNSTLYRTLVGGDPPPTFEPDLFEATLRRAREAATLQGMTGFFPYVPFFNRDDNTHWPLLHSRDNWPGLKPEFTYRLNDPSIREGLQRIKGWMAEGLAPPDSSGTATPDGWKRFYRDQSCLFSAFGTWAIPPLMAEKRAFTLHPIPQFTTGDPIGAVVGVSGFYLFRQGSMEKTRVAIRFIEFLTRDYADLKKYGVFPAMQRGMEIYAGNALMNRCGEIIRTGLMVPPHPCWGSIEETANRAFQGYLAGNNSALARGDDAISTTLANHAGNRGFNGRTPIFAGLLLLLLAGFGLLLRNFFSSPPLAREGLLLFLPGFFLLVLFNFIPVLFGLMLAFQVYPATGGLFSQFVGFENFTRILADPVNRASFFNTLIFTLISVPANLATALGVALLVFPLSRGWRTWFRGAFYLPGIASAVVVAIIWRYFFDYDNGLFNFLLAGFGSTPVKWLTSEATSLFSIILTAVLKSPGGPILIYLASMESMPREQFEAAALEGAGYWQMAWHIIIPGVRRVTLFLSMTLTIDSFQVFAPVLLLTDGGPGYSSSVWVHRIYSVTFRDLDMGLASAMSLILFFILAFFSAIQYWGSRSTGEAE